LKRVEAILKLKTSEKEMEENVRRKNACSYKKGANNSNINRVFNFKRNSPRVWSN
jgi:hypothetical protein